MKNIIIVIPARFKSTRFPGKPLANILGKPMILRVAEIAKVKEVEEIIVATENKKIANV